MNVRRAFTSLRFDHLPMLLACAVCMATNIVLGADPLVTTPTSAVADQVAAHLDAGEFGAALDLTRRASTQPEQRSLRQKIAATQQAAGESIGLSNSGGGAMADFATLIDMITQNTGGEWEITGGNGGTIAQYPYGVSVEPQGLLQRLTREEQSGSLAALARQARQADLNPEVSRRSELRLVSLTRIEQAVAQRLSNGDAITETMSRLAGLSQVKYVILYPDSHEIVIGGPAEGWQYNLEGQPIGTTNRRPTLQLDDLVTVLRTFARGEESFGCSINTRDAGVLALTDFAKTSHARGSLSPSSVRNWANQLQQKLGRQDIEIWGLPANSRVARVIVEADYRMKLIGIGKLNGGRDIPSHFDLLTANPEEGQTMQALRWWLTMKYDAVAHSTDRAVFEIQGSSVLCQSENQIQTKQGKHLATGQADTANRAFADHFTVNYDKLSNRDPVFAELQNIFDLALVAALVQHERLASRADWDLGVFAPHGEYATAQYAVPKEVDSVVNHRVYNGREIVVQVAGGVQGDMMSIVKDAKKNPEAPRLKSIAQQGQAAERPVGRWWWDAQR
ncbi:MAG: hypothetical protein JWP89_5834 [Schlesneria sp.]|nr:hypothetical protein [Schlesneria sp.]